MTREEAINEIKSWAIPSEKGREVLETLIPELAESEDERIRKDIIKTISWIVPDCQYAIVLPREQKNEWLAWLEKQKDLTTENIYKHSRERMSFWNGQQKEQKPVDLSEMMVHKEPYIAPVPTPMVADEQKPAEWSDSVAKEMFIKALERAVEQTKKGYELTDCDKHSWWEDFKAYSEIKPAEWSEEDELMMKAVIGILGEDDHPKLCSFLKSLRPSWKPSEEQDYSGLSDLERAIHRGFLCAGVENVPVAIIKETAKEVLIYAKKQLLSYADESNPAIEAMADLERTFECNPDKLPLWLKNELTKKHLEGYTLGKEATMREMSDFLKSHFNSEEAKGYNPPVINVPTWTPPCYNGGPCTNPQMDCINCPRKTTGGGFSTSSGTSTSKAEG